MFDGKVTVVLDGEESCGYVFSDIETLERVLHQYANASYVKVTIEICREKGEVEDGAFQSAV